MFWTLYYLDRSFSLAFVTPYILLDLHISTTPPIRPGPSIGIAKEEYALEVLLYGKSSSSLVLIQSQGDTSLRLVSRRC